MLALLCITHALRCTGDRAWTFILPLVLTASSGSLAPTSALSLAQALGVVLLGPVCARFVGDGKSARAVGLLVLLENVCVVLAGWLIATTIATSSTGPSACRSPLFLLALALLALDSAASSALSLLVEKEYVRRLFGSSSAAALAKANAAITGADLASSVGTYTLLGVVMRWFGPGAGTAMRMMRLLTAWHLLVACCVFWLLRRIRRCLPATSAAPGPASSATAQSLEPSTTSTSTLLLAPRLLRSVPPFVTCHMLAFALLFFTVLSPSGLLSSHLTSRGVDPSSIALFRAAAQAAGVAGTALAPLAIRKLGVQNAPRLVQRGQALLLWLGAIVAYATPPSLDRLATRLDAPRQWRELVLMAAVAASRIGLWGYDLCERQLVQT
jgi:iron-regulated transporter 1